MIRNLKVLGLAMVAAFALSAIGATAAHALTVDVGVGGQTITGTEISTEKHPNHTFTLSSGRHFKCNTVLFDGTVENGATSVEVARTLSNCFSNGNQPTTVTQNGCNYKFYGAALNNVTVDLNCPVGKEIEVHVYASAANHASNVVLCTYNVAPFVGKHKSELTNTEIGPKKDVDVTTTISIAIRRVTGPSLVCGPENQTGITTGAFTLRAYSDTAHTSQVDLSVT